MLLVGGNLGEVGVKLAGGASGDERRDFSDCGGGACAGIQVT